MQVYIFYPLKTSFYGVHNKVPCHWHRGRLVSGVKPGASRRATRRQSKPPAPGSDTDAKSADAQLLVSCACEEDTCKTPSACAARAPAGLARTEATATIMVMREKGVLMYCSNCGSLIGNGVKFCQACGAQQAPMIAANPARPAYPTQTVAAAACEAPVGTAAFTPAQPIGQDAPRPDNHAVCPSCGSQSTMLIKTTNWLKQFWWVIALVALLALGIIGTIVATPTGAHSTGAYQAAFRPIFFGSIVAISTVAGFLKRHTVEKRQCTRCGHAFSTQQVLPNE